MPISIEEGERIFDRLEQERLAEQQKKLKEQEDSAFNTICTFIDYSICRKEKEAEFLRKVNIDYLMDDNIYNRVCTAYADVGVKISREIVNCNKGFWKSKSVIKSVKIHLSSFTAKDIGIEEIY